MVTIVDVVSWERDLLGLFGCRDTPMLQTSLVGEIHGNVWEPASTPLQTMILYSVLDMPIILQSWQYAPFFALIPTETYVENKVKIKILKEQHNGAGKYPLQTLL